MEKTPCQVAWKIQENTAANEIKYGELIFFGLSRVLVVVCFRRSNVLDIISYLDPPETLCLETEQSALFGRDIMPVC